jgi:G6PDH family F420-dependent oxidoreductase
MTRYGYFLSSEENSPQELVQQARLAEEAGFDALWISDHYHPWLDEQGESSFVWSVIGAISQATSLPLTTAVTCPLLRTHPAIIAQAAATSSLLTGGRFTLGVGSGEALNEHILGTAWPSAEERLDMLDEAVEVIRELFSGRLITHHGPHYRIDTARLYSVPDSPPPIFMSGFGEKAIKLAARVADGYMCVQPNADFVRLYRDSGGGDRPVQGGLKVCWGRDAGPARKTMHRLWPNDSIPGESAQLLPLPRHFAQLSELVSEDMISAPCGPSADDHIKGIRAYVDAGFDEVYIGQVGSEHAGFFEFYAGQVLPRLREA